MATYGGTDIFEKKEQVTFREFALRMAGITAEVRHAIGDDLEARIPDNFKPLSSHHKDGIERAKKDLAKANAMTPQEAEEEARRSYNTAVKAYYDSLNHCNSLRAKYVSMKEKVNAWQPPTPEHRPLKGLMLRQLDESIEHDCSTKNLPLPGRLTGTEYKAYLIRISRESYDWHAKERAEELKRADTLTGWIQALKRSLPEE